MIWLTLISVMIFVNAENTSDDELAVVNRGTGLLQINKTETFPNCVYIHSCSNGNSTGNPSIGFSDNYCLNYWKIPNQNPPTSAT